MRRKEQSIYAAISMVTGKNMVRLANEVRDRASWSADAMARYRLARLRSLLTHAGRNVPYYRRTFAACGFDPAELSEFADLQAVPPLTRATVINSFQDLRDQCVRRGRLMAVSTGGTTGQPVTVLLDKANGVERTLVNHRMYALMGRRLGDPTLLIAGSPIDFDAWQSFRSSVKNRLFNVTVRSSFGLTPAGIKSLIAELQAKRFAYIIAYASVFDLLAWHVRRSGRQVSLENMVPCAELVSEAQRQSWKEAFAGEVFETYGSREMTSLAGETHDHSGLVMNEDLYHVEITDDFGRCVPDGQVGLITVTALLEKGMPLIRYQLGDLGLRLPHMGGDRLPFARLKVTHGRVVDVISCPDGKLLPGEFFPHLMKEVSEKVKKYQIVQEATDRLVVRIVRGVDYDEATSQYLQSKIQDQVGSGMRLDFDFADDIETSLSGKFRPTISKVPWDAKTTLGRFDGGPMDGS